MANIRDFQNIPAVVDERVSHPKDVDTFVSWLTKFYNYDHRRYANYYNVAVDELERSLYNSAFWIDFSRFLTDVNAEYQQIYTNLILESVKNPEINKKSLKSVIEKAYRKDVLNNDRYPEEPEKEGWILPTNWFSSLHDILRTTIVVKYLDGVEFLLQRLKKYAESHKCGFTFDYEARDNGYYAAHTGVQMELSMPSYDDLEPHLVPINLEIQITTQLQSVVKDLLHAYYESDRIEPLDKDYQWQWDYKSPRFNTNYLGHMVHFVEGMVVDLRDKQHQKKI